MASRAPGFYSTLNLRAYKNLSQTEMKDALGEELFQEVFIWVDTRLRQTGGPLEPSDLHREFQKSSDTARARVTPILRDLKQQWPAFSQPYFDQQKEIFFQDVAPLAFFFLANKKQRDKRYVERNRRRGSPHTASSSPDASTDLQRGSQELPQNNQGTIQAATGTAIQLRNQQRVELWSANNFQQISQMFMVDIFGKDNPTPGDLSHNVLISTYQELIHDSHLSVDTAFFRYVDPQGGNWTIFNDASLRSAFRQAWSFSAPLILFLDDRPSQDRKRPLRSPYTITAPNSQADRFSSATRESPQEQSRRGSRGSDIEFRDYMN